MKSSRHVVLSTVVAVIVAWVSKSWQATAAAWVAGIFPDVDHVLDYLVEYGLKFDVRLFFRASYEGLYRKCILPLHGWEWWILLLVASIWQQSNPWLWGGFIGYSHHLATDQFLNRGHPSAYLLTSRIRHQFNYSRFFPTCTKSVEVVD